MNAVGLTTSASDVGTADAAKHRRLVHAAQQFEAVLLGEMMKPLSGTASVGESSDDAASNPMQGFAVESMAGSMARSGALGFAQKMVAAVEKRH